MEQFVRMRVSELQEDWTVRKRCDGKLSWIANLKLEARARSWSAELDGEARARSVIAKVDSGSRARSWNAELDREG